MPEIEDIIETTEKAPLLLWWHWAILGLIVAVALFFLLRFLRHKKEQTKPVNNLKSALERLQEIQQAELDNNQLATDLSLLTREYLQSQFENKAIFQTHKEFVQDHSDLEKIPESARKKLSQYLGALADHKYHPENELPAGKDKLIALTESLLRGIDSTSPKSITP